MMIPSPSIKLDHGNVLTNIPTLPRRVGTKLISAEAVPISALTILRSTSMVKGRTMDSIIVNGRKLSMKHRALDWPIVRSATPLIAVTRKQALVIQRLETLPAICRIEERADYSTRGIEREIKFIQLR